MDISQFYEEIQKILESYLEESIVKMSDEEIGKIKEKYKNAIG